MSNEVGRTDNVRALVGKLPFLTTELDNFYIRQLHVCTYSVYLSTSDSLSFITSNKSK